MSGAAGGPADLDPALGEALAALATRARVLVALDFDGVLAPIVARPEEARPLPASARAVDLPSRSHQVTVVSLDGGQRTERGRAFPISIDSRSLDELGRSAKVQLRVAWVGLVIGVVR